MTNTRDRLYEVISRAQALMESMNDLNPWDEDEVESDYPVRGPWTVIYRWNDRNYERFRKRVQHIEKLIYELSQVKPPLARAYKVRG